MKKENGSIAIFTLVALLFMTAFLIISYANIINNSKSLKEQFNIIKGIYYKSNDDSSYTDVYTDLRKKNRQKLTAYSENSNELELNKTFASKLFNYKIYGNSVQDGTPTPDNPVEIESVGEKTKNLLDIDTMLNENLTQNADDSYTIKKTTSSKRFSNTLQVNIPADTYLSLSGEILEYNGTYDWPVQLVLTFEDDTSGTLGIANGKVWSKKYTKAIKSIRIYQEDSMPEGTYTKFKNLQLEIGDKESSYEPYGYKIPIEVIGKNLVSYPYQETTKTLNGITLTDNGDGTITVNGTATANTIFNIEDNRSEIWAGIKPNQTYTSSLSSYGNYSGNIVFVVNYYPKDATAYKAWLTAGVGKSVSKICPDDISGLRSYIYIYSGAVFDNVIFKPQLEASDKKTDYRPYIEPIKINIYLDEPLRKIGNYADYIDFKSGKVVRNIKSVKFNRNREVVSKK